MKNLLLCCRCIWQPNAPNSIHGRIMLKQEWKSTMSGNEFKTYSGSFSLNQTFRAKRKQIIHQHVCKYVWGCKVWNNGTLTPSLPQPVKFPGWKVDTWACKQYIFWFMTHPLSMLTILIKTFTYYNAKKKKDEGFPISHFYCCLFQATLWQWRG